MSAWVKSGVGIAVKLCTATGNGLSTIPVRPTGEPITQQIDADFSMHSHRNGMERKLPAVPAGMRILAFHPNVGVAEPVNGMTNRNPGRTTYLIALAGAHDAGLRLPKCKAWRGPRVGGRSHCLAPIIVAPPAPGTGEAVGQHLRRRLTTSSTWCKDSGRR